MAVKSRPGNLRHIRDQDVTLFVGVVTDTSGKYFAASSARGLAADERLRTSR